MNAAGCAKRSALVRSKEQHDKRKWEQYLRLVGRQQSGHQALKIGQILNSRA